MAIAGATNHPATIIPSFYQLIWEKPTAAIPDPIRAPITVCVPEIGMPKMEADMMKRNEAIEAASIVYSSLASG